MGYKAQVNSYVAKAFRMIGDLAEDVTLTKKTANNYNFATGNVTVTEAPTVSTKVVITDSDKMSDKHNVMTKNVLMKTQDIGDLNAYDKLTVNGQEWKFGPVLKSDGYLTTAEIFREV